MNWDIEFLKPNQNKTTYKSKLPSLLFECSDNDKNGDREASIRNNSPLVDFIKFFSKNDAAIFEKLVRLYKNGLSLRDIQAQTGISKTTIRKILIRSNVTIRPKAFGPEVLAWRNPGKRGIRPVYGFTYFEGRVVKHQKEYPVLLFIYRLWKQGKSSTAIAHALNEKEHPSRMGKLWSWNAVAGIVERFESGTLSVDGNEEVSLNPEASNQKTKKGNI